MAAVSASGNGSKQLDKETMRDHAEPRWRRLVAGAVALAVTVAVVGLLSGAAVAGDASGTLTVDPSTAEADPGETVEVDVMLRTDGGYTGAGLAEYEYELAYDADSVDVVDVDHGPWLEGDGATVTATAERTETGLLVRHERDDGGETGYGVTATVTFEVADETSPSEVVVAIDDAGGTYTSGELMATYSRDGAIVVDGGGDVIHPDGTVEERGDDDADDAVEDAGVTLADEADDEGDDAERDDDTDPRADDGADESGVPADGFGPGTALVALVSILAGAAVHRRR